MTAPVLVGGLLSGTSVDGIDALLLEVGEERDAHGLPIRWRVVGFISPLWPEPLRDEILTVLRAGSAPLATLTRLHGAIGEAMAEAFQALLETTGTAANDVAAVGSHGQTFWHIPPSPTAGRGYTLQLGCPATLAERLGISVVSDFRTRDMAAGGEGAPLVPWPDRVFFHQPGVGRALQNLGGMGNVTYLPPSGALAQVRAFDTGPGVALLDAAAAEATGGRLSCDLDGALARKGHVNAPLLEALLENPFFKTPPPRSTGRETFGHGFLAGVRAAHPDLSWEDLLATLTALTAVAAARSYRDFLPPDGVDDVVLTGGGARNPALVDAFERALEREGVGPKRRPTIRTGADALGMDPDAREAAAFALLAWAHMAGVPGSLPQVTGARAPRVLGSWTPAR